VLDVVDWDVIAKGDPEAWLYFYEDFLEIYDNKLRKLTGSYYTPPQVVQAMVRLCDEALKSSKRFGVAQGLASNQVHVADPAMGSGTYLLAVLRAIAESVEKDEGAGAVAGAISQAAKRIYGFELQFGAYAVAELRLLAEMIALEADGTPGLFVTDTLSDPYADIEAGTGIYKEISKSRAEANKIKREQPITVVIGNPPYKNEAMGKGAWIENGSGNRPAPLADWMPPMDWKVGAHAKHLRNLYVYFWRWAAWKVFEQGAGGRDRDPPIDEQLSGLVCYITVSGFLNGPGFQKMRSDLRRECDEIWVIDCSPEGHQPEVSTRIFEGVQHTVCIVLASRSPTNVTDQPAKVRFRALTKGRREEKFKELEAMSLDSKGWRDCSPDWRASFLPSADGAWSDFASLEQVIGYSGPGVKPGRTWVIAPDAQSLKDRWVRLIGEPSPEERGGLFENKTGDRHIAKAAKALDGQHGELKSIESLLEERKHSSTKSQAEQALKIHDPIRFGFRSFDRQWIIPDSRVIDRHRPDLWSALGKEQVFLTALMVSSPKSGPAVTTTALIPDNDHYKGSFGGSVFPLWRDAAGTISNISPTVLAELAKTYGASVDPVDVFAYVAALLAHPAYVERFRDDLIQPGLRVPLTADAKLFKEAAKLGREMVWLHTFGERFAEGRPAGPPRVAMNPPTVPKGGAIPSTPEGFPDSVEYDAAKRHLKIGTGHIDNVAPEVWAYEVSGKNVLRQWFSYRKRNRERPLIGDKRPPSELGNIQPDRWLPEYTSELINVLNVLTLLVELEPKQAKLLDEICDGPLIPASRITK
jgi:predicted helicase